MPTTHKMLEDEIIRLRAALAKAEAALTLARSIISWRDLNRLDILLKDIK